MLPKSFTAEITEIKSQLDLLSSLVNKIVLDSLEALYPGNLEIARSILDRDQKLTKGMFISRKK
jgi:phosphate uptake regulator